MDSIADSDAAATGTDDSPRLRGWRYAAGPAGRTRSRYPASRDSLTGLPDRAMFRRILGDMVGTSRACGTGFSVLFVGLDRFRMVNDALGHDAGDALLVAMAERLQHCAGASDVVARIGGDEFVLLAGRAGRRYDAASIARRVLTAFEPATVVHAQECQVTASIGIAMFPDDAADGAGLMGAADAAMHQAKEDGGNAFRFHRPDARPLPGRRLRMQTGLRAALDRNELSLHYQAKVDLASGRICGVEALLRWDSPELGAVAPAEFIPLAEESGLIVPIGRWALRNACAQSVAWQHQGLPALRMAVNLSTRQFCDEDLLADLAGTLASTRMDPSMLELELTEAVVVRDTQRAARVLSEIKKLGVHLAIDDFGTGYSSFAQLKRFPIDILKVDRSFISDIPGSAEDRDITGAIIAMGKAMHLTVVAEGVETDAQKAFLRAHDCDQMQGFLFSAPVPADRFAELLAGQGG